MGTSKAPTTFGSQTDSLGFGGGQSDAAGLMGELDEAADDAATGSSDDSDNTALPAATSKGEQRQQQQQQVLPAVAINASGRTSTMDSSQGGALSPTSAAAAESEADVQRARSAQSKTAQLRSYLFEQVDSAAAWERHISAALGSK
jgi:hypothetical protein